MATTPAPLPYHDAIIRHLQEQEPSLWQWYASTRSRNDGAEALRLDLLKSTYRLEPESQPALYELANAVRETLQLSCSVTLYQAQTAYALNAALAYLPGEAHIIFSGPIANVLSENETRAVLAHELAHFLMYEDRQGDYLVGSDLLRALSADPVAGAAASESARLYSLWSEIYADRWAFHVSQDVAAAITTLIKVDTGLSEVSAESYLRQAEEIFTKSAVQADHFSHPEPYIRARALKLWADQGEDAHAEIERMIEGGLNLQRLDLLGQKNVAQLTRRFFQMLLAPKWFQTEPVVTHAKRFFADFEVVSDIPSGTSLRIDLERSDSSVRDYFCYLMLDFATVDRELEDVALSAAIVAARQLGIEQRLAELAQKELGLGKRAYGKIDKDAESLLARTEAAQPT